MQGHWAQTERQTGMNYELHPLSSGAEESGKGSGQAGLVPGSGTWAALSQGADSQHPPDSADTRSFPLLTASLLSTSTPGTWKQWSWPDEPARAAGLRQQQAQGVSHILNRGQTTGLHQVPRGRRTDPKPREPPKMNAPWVMDTVKWAVHVNPLQVSLWETWQRTEWGWPRWCSHIRQHDGQPGASLPVQDPLTQGCEDSTATAQRVFPPGHWDCYTWLFRISQDLCGLRDYRPEPCMEVQPGQVCASLTLLIKTSPSFTGPGWPGVTPPFQSPAPTTYRMNRVALVNGALKIRS